MLEKVFALFVLLNFVAKSQKYVKEKQIEIPSFLPVCHRNGTWYKCVSESVERLRPLLAEGIPEFGVPKLEPLCIPNMTINQGNCETVFIRSTFSRIKVCGLSKFHMRGAKIDLKKNRIRFRMRFRHIKVISKYEMNGHILRLPVSGQGKSTANFTNLDFNAELDAERVMVDKYSYFNITHHHFDFFLGSVRKQFDYICKADKIGDTVNTFLKHNWKNVACEIQPLLESTIVGIFRSFSEKLFNNYPVELLLPE